MKISLIEVGCSSDSLSWTAWAAEDKRFAAPSVGLVSLASLTRSTDQVEILDRNPPAIQSLARRLHTEIARRLVVGCPIPLSDCQIFDEPVVDAVSEAFVEDRVRDAVLGMVGAGRGDDGVSQGILRRAGSRPVSVAAVVYRSGTT